MNVTLLAFVGGIIILGLASYAGYLLLQLKKQKELQLKHQKLAIEKRNANIFENVNTLCLAGIQGQCDLSEISIRVYCIMDYVQGDDRVDFDTKFPATAELYHINQYSNALSHNGSSTGRYCLDRLHLLVSDRASSSEFCYSKNGLL